MKSTAMRKSTFFSVVLSLFLLLPASITWAQTTKFISGMVVTDYPTQYGIVKVYMPGGDTLRAGQLITGTVTAEPGGNNEKEKNKNWIELMKFSLDVAGKKIALTDKATPFDFIVPSGPSNTVGVQLWNESGRMAPLKAQFYVSDHKPWMQNNPGPGLVFIPDASNSVMNFSVDPVMPVIGESFKIYSTGNIVPKQFDFTDRSGKTYTIKPFCGSSHESFFTLPNSVQPGPIISKIEWSATNDKPSESVTLSFNAIKTEYKVQDPNIHKGRQTQVDGWINGLPADPAKAPCIVLQNTTTNIVNMAQGNSQQIAIIPSPNGDGTYGFHFQRTLTGLMDGAFTISATLHYPPAVNDPFRSQLETLQTPEQFNSWAEALKNDLYRQYHNAGTTADAVSKNQQLDQFINQFQDCKNANELDQLKTIAANQLQPVMASVPDIVNWDCTVVAADAALQSANNFSASSPYINWPVLQNGLQNISINGLKEVIGDDTKTEAQQLQQQADSLRKLQEQMQQLQQQQELFNEFRKNYDEILKEALKNIRASYNGPDPVNDLIGFLDPKTMVLMAVPEYQQIVLSRCHAILLANGQYQVRALTAYRQPLNIVVSLKLMPQLYISRFTKKELDDLERLIDSLNRVAQADKTMGTFQYTTIDKDKATWSRFFKNALCSEVTPEYKEECGKNLNFIDPVTKKPIVPKNPIYSRLFIPADKQCKKGDKECVEYYTLCRRKTQYEDQNCTIEINKYEYFKFMCE